MTEILRRDCWKCRKTWPDGQHECECGSLRRVLVIRCACKREFALEDGFLNTCACGRDYNASGQLLAPRSQWGEETGETLADILGPAGRDDW